jgi:hypothetical protein
MPHEVEAFVGREQAQRDRDEVDDLVEVARARRLSLDDVFRLEETRTVSNDWVVRSSLRFTGSAFG